MSVFDDLCLCEEFQRRLEEHVFLKQQQNQQLFLEEKNRSVKIDNKHSFHDLL